jgi:hypothetical protein
MPFQGKWVRRVFIFVVALLCVGAGVGVGRLTTATLFAKAVPAAHVSHRGQSAAVQGVKVHGWWTIKVLDHGRLVNERQFENALVGSGASDLASLLTGGESAGHWNVFVYDSSSYPTFLFDLVQLRPDLNVSASGGHVILSGNYTATAAISIGKVQTALFTCAATATASNCTTGTAFGTGHIFTEDTLGTPVAVANGQIVQVSVAIIFS